MFSSNTSQVSGGYQISRSLRFNSADSAYLNRTPASATNRKTYTFSGWVKVAGNPGNFLNVFLAQSGGTYAYLSFNNSNNLTFASTGDGSTLITTAVYRDYSAWYHIVLAVDTTQATASNRIKLYVNGSQITSFSTETYPSQNADTQFNTTLPHFIGSNATPGNFFIGYATEINFIDGQQLTPSSFGETNAQTGVWQPKAYAGSYGTNGFYLNFSDNSNTTAATLGKDYSGNGNNWTPNNFSVAAGAGNDSLVDSPTAYGTDTGVGGTVRGNYATLNPLDMGANVATANGNLDTSVAAGGVWIGVRSTFGMQAGKWYCEYTPTSGTFHIVSISQPQAPVSGYIVNSSAAWGYQWDGQKITNNTASSYGASWGVGDIIGIAFDADAGTLTFYKNNVSQGTAFTGLTSGPYIVGLGIYPTATGTFNFGQRPFAYTAPSGFKALCTQNLPTPAIGATTATQAGKFFNPVLYTGNRPSTQSISGVGFQPDFVWIKGRANTWFHRLYDAVRGATKALESNTTSAEFTASGLTSFNSDGFTVGSDPSENQPSEGFVAWNWKANGAGVTNTAGSITSTVSANTTSGFSIVRYNGTSANATIGHGLGVAPKMIIRKYVNDTDSWYTYHASLGADKYLALNETSAATTSTAIWQNTAPTSTVFSIGFGNNNSNSVAYCFAEVPGYSRFGSYTGNGSSDGAFIFTGFRPKYVLVKRTDSSFGWWVFDDTRNPTNIVDKYLSPNLSDAEYTFGILDFTSNGFKFRDASQGWNASGGTYIFAAFAEAPFKYALAR